MRVIYLSFFLIFALTACSDDVIIETEAQLTAKRLQADIDAKAANIQVIYVIDLSNDINPLIFTGSSYVITPDGFIVITSDNEVTQTFNLGELKSYVVATSILALYY